MSSAAKVRANRRNARRHGLTIPVYADPALAPEVDSLARQIAQSVVGKRCDPHEHALACRIAEAMIDLRRVRLAKLPLVTALHADPKRTRPLGELARLDRYERGALWRRKLAVRDFVAAVSAQNQPRNANDFKDRAHPSTAGGKGCVPPRDPVGSATVPSHPQAS